jgi:hypothetical protein
MQPFSGAQYTPKVNSAATEILGKLAHNILQPIVILLFLIATVVFMWGVYKMIRNGDDAKARAEGGQHILWGLVGMAIMSGAYSIIYIILNTIGVSPQPFF